jgi:hypothetical protein
MNNERLSGDPDEWDALSSHIRSDLEDRVRTRIENGDLEIDPNKEFPLWDGGEYGSRLAAIAGHTAKEHLNYLREEAIASQTQKLAGRYG